MEPSVCGSTRICPAFFKLFPILDEQTYTNELKIHYQTTHYIYTQTHTTLPHAHTHYTQTHLNKRQ